MEQISKVRWPVMIVSALTKQTYRESGGSANVFETFCEVFEEIFGEPLDKYYDMDSDLGKSLNDVIDGCFCYAAKFDGLQDTC